MKKIELGGNCSFLKMVANYNFADAEFLLEISNNEKIYHANAGGMVLLLLNGVDLFFSTELVDEMVGQMKEAELTNFDAAFTYLVVYKKLSSDYTDRGARVHNKARICDALRNIVMAMDEKRHIKNCRVSNFGIKTLNMLMLSHNAKECWDEEKEGKRYELYKNYPANEKVYESYDVKDLWTWVMPSEGIVEKFFFLPYIS